MTDWLEFHDSVLAGLDQREKRVEVLLDAYIHRWERLHDRWRGTGCMQGVRILVSEATGPSAVPMLPADISSGWLRLAAHANKHFVRLPFQASGEIRIWLQLTTGDIVEISGSAASIEATADARYVEELPADLRPQDLD